MSKVLEHIEILGLEVKDKVTGFKGVATSISFDLYGCIQVVVNPGMDKDGKLGDQHWFDKNRLVLDGYRIMPVPDYVTGRFAEGDSGPAEKPRMNTN